MARSRRSCPEPRNRGHADIVRRPLGAPSPQGEGVLVAPGTSSVPLALDLNARLGGGDYASSTSLFVKVGDFAANDDAVADLCRALIKNPKVPLQKNRAK